MASPRINVVVIWAMLTSRTCFLTAVLININNKESIPRVCVWLILPDSRGLCSLSREIPKFGYLFDID